MELETFHFLLSPEGQALLADLARRQVDEGDTLREASRLRQDYPAPLVSAALETTLLRRRAVRKFSRASQMYFTREALEQATPELVALHRARRFAGLGSIADLGCSIGGDALALAAQAPVLAVDQDELRLAMLVENARAYEVSAQLRPLKADLTTLELAGEAEAVFFDPARREDGRRRLDPARYLPPLATVERWLTYAHTIAVKVAPGIGDEDLPPGCEAEWVSLDGELREACLWLGAGQLAAREMPGAGAGRILRRATILPSGATLVDNPTPPAPLSDPLRYLYEPDPAVIRAHLVAQLAPLVDGAQIDRDIAFLTSDRLVATPFARAWEVEEWLPFNLKALRKRLRKLDVGDVVVKKRGSPITPEQLRGQLRLSGSETRVVVLTQLRDHPVALICRELAKVAGEPLLL